MILDVSYWTFRATDPPGIAMISLKSTLSPTNKFYMDTARWSGVPPGLLQLLCQPQVEELKNVLSCVPLFAASPTLATTGRKRIMSKNTLVSMFNCFPNPQPRPDVMHVQFSTDECKPGALHK